MNEQLNAAKDQAASEIYQTDFKTAIIDIIGDYYNGIVELTDRAMEIYAEKVAVDFAERLRRNYTNHLTGGGGWRYYGDKKPKVITTQELFNRFNTKP